MSVSIRLLFLLTLFSESHNHLEVLYENGTKECFASVLKNMFLIERSFPSEPFPLSNHQKVVECEILKVKPALDQFHEDVVRYLGVSGSYEVEPFELRSFEKFESCVMDIFGKYKITYLFLKGITLHLYNVSRISDLEKEFARDRRFLVHLALDVCNVDNLDRKFNKLPRWNVTKDREDLCKRKYLFDERIIDPIEWNIDMQQFKVDNCDYALKIFKDKVDMLQLSENSTVFGLHVSDASLCIYRRYKRMKLNQHREAIKILLTDFSLNGQKIVWLREKFFRLEMTAAEIAIECLALAMMTAMD